jgi:predicted RNA-binding Zn-ribbon protein involved in translation (DUF1610 family)
MAEHVVAPIGACRSQANIEDRAVLMKCPTCGTRVSRSWLLLGLPWSKHSCAECGSVLAGTILRFIQNSIAVGVIGVFIIRIVKGKTTPIILPLIIGLGLILFLFNLPGQIKTIRATTEYDGRPE